MRGAARHILTRGATLLAVVGLSACGGGGSGTDVVRVGSAAIGKATVEHWTTVLAGGRQAIADPALRKRVVSFLTTAEWTRAEAAELGVEVTDGDAQRQLDQISYDRREGIPYEGLPKQGELPLLFASQTARHADRIFLMKLALLMARVKQRQLTRAAQQLTNAQIAGYYEAHLSQFIMPEQRDIQWIVTYSASSLSKAVREIRSGKSFVSVASRVSLDPPISTGLELAKGKEREFLKNVFAAKPHVLSGPYLQTKNHYVLEVTRVVPARQLSLSESEASIRQRLATQAVSSEPATLERAWTARTSCRPGYIVAQCGHPL